MKRIVAVLLLIVLLSFVLAQDRQYRQNPPKPSDFPRANNSCLSRHKLYVSSIQGVPVGHDASGSARVSCQFITLTCDGTPVTHASIPRDGGLHVCDDWEAARDALDSAGIYTCCDREGANATQPAEDEKPECPSPTSWFENSASCQEKRAPWIAVQGRDVVVRLCGLEVFRGTTPGTSAAAPDAAATRAYRDAVSSYVRSQIGSSVCCDKFRDSVRTGMPCNPANDVDCDGIPNASDTSTVGGMIGEPD